MPRGEPFDVDAFLARSLVARVATAGPTVRPVWFLWEEGAFWWLTGAYARLPALLAQDPRVALVVDSCDLATGEVRQVTAHGEAELVDFDADRARRKLARYLGADETAWDPRFRTRFLLEPETGTRFVRLAPQRLRSTDLSFRAHGNDLPELAGEHVVLRALTPADEPVLRAALHTPQVARWWQPRADDPDVGDPDTPRLAILVDGELVGLIQFLEEDEPDYRHAAIDLFVAPSHHGRGVGTDALRTLVRHLVEERGHHRIIIDPATDNVAAVRCYEKAGFRPVGVLHGEWFDHSAGAWRDALMMELVVGLADA
jgi:aminoglycoside 6'-N-acetyltransferase